MKTRAHVFVGCVKAGSPVNQSLQLIQADPKARLFQTCSKIFVTLVIMCLKWARFLQTRLLKVFKWCWWLITDPKLVELSSSSGPYGKHLCVQLFGGVYKGLMYVCYVPINHANVCAHTTFSHGFEYPGFFRLARYLCTDIKTDLVTEC